MTDAAQMQAQVMGKLVGPGGPFEMVPAEVFGTTLPVFANRDRNLQQVLADSAQYGDRPYIITREETLSFTDHLREVAGLAEKLRTDHGIEAGDRVMIAGANRVEWIVAFWAIQALGAVAVAGNAWWSAREWAHGLGLTTPKLVVADRKRADAMAEVIGDLPLLSFDDVRGHGTSDSALPEVSCDEMDPAAILFTSGTSGLAKAVTHVHLNMSMVNAYHRMNDAIATAFGDPTDPKDKRYLLALPLFHIASLHNLAMPRLATGSTVVLHLGAFDVDQVCRLIESARVTSWGAPPTMAHRMVEHGVEGYDLSSLTSFALATAPSSPAFKERVRAGLPFATQMVDSYGMTETSTGAAVATPMDVINHPGTVGRAGLGIQIEIRDVFNEPVADGVEGEVCVRSAYNMAGYWGNEEATRQALEPDHWLHTGDIGMLRDGLLYLTSRRSDLILRGGENVYPAEVENVLTEHPAVREVAVVGIEHADLGQEVMAVVVIDDRAEVSEEALQEYAAGQLAYYKVPSKWQLTTEPLPRNATGKVARKQLPGQG
ncbi:class I adenylate-forming enzyme family protein [Enemella sp. A6]|uniref:class I adenylate-forming enzyme family protein n=1 Tax=Enemella sp. A6 TaxID=3440152 RepID=UPI003EBEB386